MTDDDAGGMYEMLHPETREAARQWEIDHPDGISAEEEESMARYAYDSCREEGCR